MNVINTLALSRVKRVHLGLVLTVYLSDSVANTKGLSARTRSLLVKWGEHRAAFQPVA